MSLTDDQTDTPPRGNAYLMLWKTAWRYARGARKQVLLFHAMIIVANIVFAFQPWVLGKIINTLQAGGDDVIRHVAYWFGAYVGIMLVFWIFHGPARVIERQVAFQIKSNFFQDYYAKVLALPMAWHQDHHSGSTINRINKAGNSLNGWAGQQFMYIESAVRFTGPLVGLSIIAPYMALAALITAIVITRVIGFFDKRLMAADDAQNKAEHHFSSALFDFVSNISTLITLQLGQPTRGELGRRLNAIYPHVKREIIINEWKWFTFMIMATCVEAAVIFSYLNMQTAAGAAIMLGTVVTVFQYFRQIDEVFFRFAWLWQELIRAQVDLQAVLPVQEAYDALVAPTAAEITYHQLGNWQSLKITDLHFEYDDPRTKKHVLADVNLEFKRGQRIAFVGPSGAGKSTLLKLLRGLYQTTPLTLQADNQIFSTLAPLAPLSMLVPQEPEIFENTILYNMTLGVDVAAEDLQRVIRCAALEQVIKELPHGLATDIREKGVNLSGGQKQRLALARGLLAAQHAAILLMDEPTSSVDPATEGLIFDRILSEYMGKTIITSLHRLHLLSRFDLIYVMQEGKIIQEGRFQQLVAEEGLFKQLWQNYLREEVLITSS